MWSVLLYGLARAAHGFWGQIGVHADALRVLHINGVFFYTKDGSYSHTSQVVHSALIEPFAHPQTKRPCRWMIKLACGTQGVVVRAAS